MSRGAKIGLQFGNFVFCGLRIHSGISQYGNANSYLHGEDVLQHLTDYTSSFGVEKRTLCSAHSGLVSVPVDHPRFQCFRDTLMELVEAETLPLRAANLRRAVQMILRLAARSTLLSVVPPLFVTRQ